MMNAKRAFPAICSIFLSVAIAAAGDVPSTQPAAQAARPAIVGRPLVEVFAFAAVGDAAHQDWIGRGIQENLQTDVTRTGGLLVVTPQPPPAGADPVAVAKQNGANLAVIGSYQIVAGQVRVNGHLIDTAGNNTIGSFAATGPEQDLFKLEDALGEQLRHLLPLPPVNQQMAQSDGTAAPSQPQVIYSQPATVTNYYDSAPATPYYYPDSFYPSYYGDDYPYYSGFYGDVEVAPFFYYGGGFGGRYYDHRGFGGGLHVNPGFRNPVYHSGGRSFGGGGFHGGGGGGFHGGGGGGRR